MNGGYRALICGIEGLGVVDLVKRLGENDIVVFGVGESLPKGVGNEAIRLVSEIKDLEMKMEYVFDFEGNSEVWNKAASDGAKLTLISINGAGNFGEIEVLNKLGVNWRKIEVRGVYGVGMESQGKGVEYLVGAIMAAVENKNLVLPPAKKTVRVISSREMVEAVMRATILTSTEKKNYLVVGNEISFEKIATVLIEEAKMTKYKVVQEEMEIEEYDEGEIERTKRELRWEPNDKFEEEIGGTLQYYFSMSDEEKRKSKKGAGNPPSQKNATARQSGRFEVMVEDMDDETGNPPQRAGLELDSGEEEKVEEVPIEAEKEIDDWGEIEDVDEVEEEDEGVVGRKIILGDIPNLMVKNSNSRLVGGQTEVKKEVLLPPVVIQKVTDEDSGNKKLDSGLEQKKIQIKTSKIHFGKVMVGMGLAIGIVIILGGVVVGWKMAALAGGIKRVPELVKEKKYDEAEKLAETTELGLAGVDETLSEWGVNQFKWGRNVQEAARALGEVAGIEKNAVGLAQSGSKLFEGIFKDKEINWENEITKVQTELGIVESQMGILQARLRGDWGWLPQKYKQLLSGSQKQLNEYKEMVRFAEKMTTVMPEVLGLDGKRREYLVLFQNESELRAGGGFIGSYGILSFEAGKLMNMEIKDVYEADGQLKGHVEPPVEIKKYLGEANWYMRDANWQPSFTMQSKDLQWFLEKETGRKVDGVIGVDLAVAKAILGVTGEITVTDFKEKVNKNNLYEQAEFYSETNSFPGSNQKASFLGGVGKQLFESIKGLNQEKSFELGKVLIDQLKRNEIQVALNEKKAAAVMADLGWDGALYNNIVSSKNQDKKTFDYLYILESNFGVNKANYFIYRNIEEVVEISQNSVGRVLRVNYENTSKNTNWPGGDYKNYVRVYIPKEVNLAEVSIFETGKPETKNIINGEALSVKEVAGKKEVGFLMTVPVLKKITMEMRYSSNIDLTKTDKFSYINYVQKQPGYGDTGMVTLVSFPEGWQPTQVEPEASLVGGKVLFNQKLEGDVKIGVEIGK